jgi:protein SCO1
MRARWMFAAACCWLALSCAAQNATVFRSVDFEQHLDRLLPLSVMLRDATGNVVPLGRHFGGPPVLLVLGYVRCPNLCGTAFIGVNEALRQSGLRLNTDVRPLFISIDPAEMLDDTMFRRPEAELKAWHFLRGNDASIRQVADAVGFRYVYDPQIKQYAHPAGFVVVAPDGRIARYFFGVRFPPAMLRLAVTEASHGKSGSLADRLLLLCYHYDPQAGRYNLVIMQSLRILSAMLLLGLIMFIWHQYRAGKGPR